MLHLNILYYLAYAILNTIAMVSILGKDPSLSAPHLTSTPAIAANIAPIIALIPWRPPRAVRYSLLRWPTARSIPFRPKRIMMAQTISAMWVRLMIQLVTGIHWSPLETKQNTDSPIIPVISTRISRFWLTFRVQKVSPKNNDFVLFSFEHKSFFIFYFWTFKRAC